ncbi:MAG: hypothetical protein H6767_04445 [Candidatus Peribacteria bacterium]|nr:MAG: hypothetical protein H6767_04445 [Candidatus Peribacteria bacterium]
MSSYIEPENKESFKKEIFEISSGAASFIDVESILVEVKALSEQALFVILSLFLYIVFFCLLCVSLIILFFHQLQVRKSWLYTLIGVQKRQNRLRVFTEYAYIATMNIVISMMVVMTACFYLF